MSKKRLLVCLAAVMALTLITAACGGGGTAPGGAAAQETFSWRLAHEENEGELQHVFALALQEELAARSDGRIHIDIFTVGQLGVGEEQVELLQAGGIELAINNPGHTASFIPEVNVFELHYVLPTEIHRLNRIINEGEGIQYINQLFAGQSMHVINWFPSGANFWTSNRAIRTPADFVGFRMRTMAAPIIGRSYEVYGANPIVIPFTELYSALQLGMADGQVNPVSSIVLLGFYEVQDYLIAADTDSFKSTFVANMDFWNSLPADIQQIVVESAAAANATLLAEMDEINRVAMERAREVMTVIDLTEAEIDAFRQLAHAARPDFFGFIGEGGPRILELFDADVARFS